MRQAEAWNPGTGFCLPGPLMVHSGTAWPGRRVVQRARAGRDAFVAGRVPVAMTRKARLPMRTIGPTMTPAASPCPGIRPPAVMSAPRLPRGRHSRHGPPLHP